MDHLDVVAGTSLANPVTAGLAVDLSRGLLEDLFDSGPCSGGTTGHERGAVARTLFTTRDTRADEKQALLLQLLSAADRVGIMGVAAIDDDVTSLQVRGQLGDEIIDGRTSLHKEDDLAGPLELGNKLLDGMGALNLGA